MSDVLKKLQDYARQGKLFHGSPVFGLKRLEPQWASDTDSSNTFNNDLAVFASASFCMSIIFGLVDREKVSTGQEAFTWAVGCLKSGEEIKITSKIPEQWRQYLEEEAVGYVYVFSEESFSETDGVQCKSKSPAEPIDCIQVTLKDFFAAGGKIEWAPAKSGMPVHKTFNH